MNIRTTIKTALLAALPIMAGYVAIGLPAGIMESQIGMSAFQAFALSVIFYSGAGQFMIPSMLIGGFNLPAIIASVSLVNTRQVLYGASLSQYCTKTNKILAFFFAATVTDESFGVNVERLRAGNWTVEQSFLVNVFSMLTWASANAVGVVLGSMLTIPVVLGSFAMTSIFICLLCTQHFDSTIFVVVGVTIAVVCICKFIGLAQVAILVGAIAGVLAGYLKQWRRVNELG